MGKDAKKTYKDSGVDVVAGDQLVDWLHDTSKPKQAHHQKIVSGIGGFASLFRADFSQMKKPCLVTCTDGVGTKVKLASYFKDYKTVGQDLVAMCVNDLICTGGEPLLFLDYYATSKLDLVAAKEFLSSVRAACEESSCALVGGETAEMPGVYHDGDFDCAGFAVGVVDEDQAWGAQKVKAGDRLLGISSSGFHSNGFSLLRKVFEHDLDQYRQALLEPTALYVKVVQALKKEVQIHAAAHITGGGVENIPRVIPEVLQAQWTAWPLPPLFVEVQKRTGLTDLEMRQTLNCGLGFVLVLPASEIEKAREIISKFSFQSFEMGVVI